MRNIIDINSNDNALFTTAMCNNRCIMCCQPPQRTNDIEKNWKNNLKLIINAPKNLPSIGITGGEPTLLGDRFFVLIQTIRENLPNTEIHILTNGRRFSDKKFASRLADLGTDNILIGIPLHSDNELDHDLIAGVKGAFSETMLGLYNLARFSFDIELRIVLMRLNYKRLPQMGSFIFKNIPFVKYISLMGLENTGDAIKNKSIVYVDPVDLAENLRKVALYLSGVGLNVSIFNLSHCILPEILWQFARKSISDWKVRYEPFCSLCTMKNDCCGLFATSAFQSSHLHPINY